MDDLLFLVFRCISLKHVSSFWRNIVIIILLCYLIVRFDCVCNFKIVHLYRNSVINGHITTMLSKINYLKITYHRISNCDRGCVSWHSLEWMGDGQFSYNMSYCLVTVFRVRDSRRSI